VAEKPRAKKWEMLIFVWFFAMATAGDYQGILSSPYVTNVVLGLILFIVIGVLLVYNFCKLHYLNWLVVNKYSNNPLDYVNPYTAVGRLFIPFYNLYWQFISVHKLSTQQEEINYNNQISSGSNRPSKSLALAYCILNLCALIPYIGSACSVINLVIMPLVLKNQTDASISFLRNAKPTD
jgi:hypothetical protein